MEKMIECQIESLKEKIKQAKDEKTTYALCYLEGQLAAYENMLEEIQFNK
jgi:hypoxanthine-guanine phosphoribosyltransferase